MFRRFFVVCLVAYSLVVAWFTLRSLPYERGSIDWIPFSDTWQLMRDRGDRPALREVASNFALFVPLGYFLQGALRRRLLITFALAAAAS
ncbi:MAG TPA: VanZ family protein, partial [Actinomycetota bacterium]